MSEFFITRPTASFVKSIEITMTSTTVQLPRRVMTCLGAAFLLHAANPAHAEDNGTHIRALTTTNRFIPDEPRADPDQPSLRYGLHGGRWKAMSGASILLVGVESDRLRIGLSFAGFLELINFNQGDPVPWQSYRANIGADIQAESPHLNRAYLPAGGRLSISVGWFHESDHAAAVSSYESQFLSPRPLGAFSPFFDNANFSAYEYVKVRATYRQSLWKARFIASVAFGARFFPEPINSGSIRLLRSSILVDSRLSIRIWQGIRPFVSVYHETIDNDFIAQNNGFNFGLDQTALRYAIANVGVDLVGPSGTIMSPYIAFSRSHGRGVDFPKFYGSEIGFGIIWML